MSIFVYGGLKEQVEKQLNCQHENWHGPCMDSISRYNKCPECLCLERDFCSMEEYYESFREEDEYNEEIKNDLIDAETKIASLKKVLKKVVDCEGSCHQCNTDEGVPSEVWNVIEEAKVELNNELV